VPCYRVIDDSDERQGERAGLPQRVDDARLASITERVPGKRARRERSNRLAIGDRFRTNQKG